MLVIGGVGREKEKVKGREKPREQQCGWVLTGKGLKGMNKLKTLSWEFETTPNNLEPIW